MTNNDQLLMDAILQNRQLIEKLFQTIQQTKPPSEWLDPSSFAVEFKVSKSQQAKDRIRENDPLPYRQREIGSKVLYKRSEVSDWMERNFTNA